MAKKLNENLDWDQAHVLNQPEQQRLDELSVQSLSQKREAGLLLSPELQKFFDLEFPHLYLRR